MRDWCPQRSIKDGRNFLADIEALGGDMLWLWETVRPKIEDALCGVSTAKLNEEYPADRYGVREVLTDWTMGFPPARIAFRLEQDGVDEAIVYLAVTRRVQS